MGGLRAAVGVVLGVISLAVLSLHVALCLHYPSPLFAVTLLLNPSLWLFLGLIGMGCAMLLTHRDQQRKVRAGHCTTCHPQYGSTVDTKWRTQEAKCRAAQLHCQRGPSRAIYSYNGNLHKFYASYGTINEKQVIEMKHSALKTSSNNNKEEKHDECHSGEPMRIRSTKNDLKCQNDNTEGKVDADSSAIGLKIPYRNDTCDVDDGVNNNRSEKSQSNKIDEKLGARNENNHNDCTDKGNVQSGNNENSQKEEFKAIDSLNKSPACSPYRRAQQEMLYREARYCDCMARYGAIYHYPYSPRSKRYYATQDQDLERYNQKLLMRCKLKPPHDVPVDLFAAKDASDKSEANSQADVNGEKSNAISPSPELERKCDCEKQNNVKEKSHQISEDDVSSVGCTDSTSLSSFADLSGSKESMAINSHKNVSSNFIVPLKHMPRFSAHTSSLPLGSPYKSKNNQFNQLEEHESTSLSSEQTASEHDSKEQDGISISSKSSLLPSSPEKSMSSKDLAKSPLWHPFKSSIMGRKKIPDENKGSNDASGCNSANEGQESSPTSLRSVFTSKRSFTKSVGERRKISISNNSDSNENISSDSTSSSSSPALNEKKLQTDSSRSVKSKSISKKQLSTKSSQKNSKALLISPAKAVRSLVFRNVQKRTSRVRKDLDGRNENGDFIPAKLPLLSPPTKELSTLTSGSNTEKPLPKENINISTSTLSKEVAPSSKSTFSTNYNSLVQTSGSSIKSTSESNSLKMEVKEQLPKISGPESSIKSISAGESGKSSNTSRPVTSSNFPSEEASPTSKMISSSSSCVSPSVRPKEPKKPKIRLKGKTRSRPSESVLLLTADSDD